MEPIKTLLESYAEADEEQRLSMFLTHRDLRGHFTKIDMREAARLKMARPVRTSVSGASWCWGWLKHCRLAR